MIGTLAQAGPRTGQGGRGGSATQDAGPDDFVWPGRGRRASRDGERAGQDRTRAPPVLRPENAVPVETASKAARELGIRRPAASSRERKASAPPVAAEEPTKRECGQGPPPTAVASRPLGQRDR